MEVHKANLLGQRLLFCSTILTALVVSLFIGEAWVRIDSGGYPFNPAVMDEYHRLHWIHIPIFTVLVYSIVFLIFRKWTFGFFLISIVAATASIFVTLGMLEAISTFFKPSQHDYFLDLLQRSLMVTIILSAVLMFAGKLFSSLIEATFLYVRTATARTSV